MRGEREGPIAQRWEGEVGGRQTVKSLFKMVDILGCFSAAEPALSVVQLAQRTGLPRTTVHRLVDSLRAAGFLEQEARGERYRLGLKLFEIGSVALANLPLYREARPFVDTLSKLSGEVVHLFVFDGAQMVFLERATDQARPSNVITTMEATPCHCTGVGKAALAFQPSETIERVIARGLRRFTPATIVDPEALRAELAATRARGYAIDECENEPDLRCIAAPIRNAAGNVFAAVSVSGPRRRIAVERTEALAEMVAAHARLISVQLGWRAAGR
ncbi:MAG: IclR family transcriptional regulator [Proteobacteria bacterium]|nr:IclR family transcriptional regulator [Pseudomonadota bacterium]